MDNSVIPQLGGVGLGGCGDATPPGRTDKHAIRVQNWTASDRLALSRYPQLARLLALREGGG
jgi:hypothetical protein